MLAILITTLFMPTASQQPATEPPAPQVVLDARGDCRIIFERDPNNGDLAYARNNNTSRRVVVTVSCTESTPLGSRQLPDKVLHLAPGEKQFVGGTRSGNATYTYRIAGAYYE